MFLCPHQGSLNFTERSTRPQVCLNEMQNSFRQFFSEEQCLPSSEDPSKSPRVVLILLLLHLTDAAVRRVTRLLIDGCVLSRLLARIIIYSRAKYAYCGHVLRVTSKKRNLHVIYCG